MTEKELKEMVIVPRDPVAYPVAPKRTGLSRRPVFRVIEEEMEAAGMEG